MFAQVGEALLLRGRPAPGASASAPFPGDGAFDRVADLARFLLNADAGIVDLGDRLMDASGLGVSTAPKLASGLTRIADPVAALKLGFASQASVPIRVGETRLGTLAVVNRGEQDFSARDIETLHRLAELVSEAISLRTDQAIR